jgi:hypothetical protein
LEGVTYPHRKKFQPQKKRTKSHIPKESNLDENEKLVASYVMELNDKYVCEVKNHKHCLIKDDRHLSLSNFAISLWAKEIVCIFKYFTERLIF